VVGKLLEKILNEGINGQLERHGLIRDIPHGFVTGWSCLTNLLELFESIIECADEGGGGVNVVYIDFSKAFDKVQSVRLIEKFKAHGIQGNLARWIRN